MGRLDRSDYQGLMDEGPFLEAVFAERVGQDDLWGPPITRGHSLSEWSIILGREYGEVLDALGNILWNRIGLKPSERLLNLRSELIQLAAVAGAIVEVLDTVSADLIGMNTSPSAEPVDPPAPSIDLPLREVAPTPTGWRQFEPADPPAPRSSEAT